MEIASLGTSDLDALVDFAQRPEVARFGEHLETDPSSVWAAWLGEPDPQRRMTIAVRDGGEMACAARLSIGVHRRRIHVGALDLVAPWEGADDAVDAAVGALVDAADRWMQLCRLELYAPAGHPRVTGVLAAHGFEVETTRRGSILRDGAYADEVGLGRLRPGTRSYDAIAGRPTPAPRSPGPGELRFRPVVPADAPAWTRALSDESVLWGTLQLPYPRVEHWEQRLRTNDPAQIFITGPTIDGELAGGGVLFVSSVFRRRHAAGLGMHVDPRHHGRGVGHALMAELLRRATALGLHRVELEVFGDNPRALRIYEGAGFAHEGTRKLACFRDGAFVDDLMMSWLRE
ncbi:MAG: GNAT family N-acetyltransferase [Sandaracinaceae bacterium]|nr:GNAT family N-acetyltransferase [Sandaracinaceae bacterium]